MMVIVDTLAMFVINRIIVDTFAMFVIYMVIIDTLAMFVMFGQSCLIDTLNCFYT